LSIAEF